MPWQSETARSSERALRTCGRIVAGRARPLPGRSAATTLRFESELRSLLAAHDRAPNLLEHLAAEVLPAALDAVATDGHTATDRLEQSPSPSVGAMSLPTVARARSGPRDSGAHRCRRHRHRLSRRSIRAAATGCDQDTRLERAGCARVAPARGACGVGAESPAHLHDS